MKTFFFYKSCEQIGSGELDYLNEMIDNAIDITRETFMKHCDIGNMDYQLGYERRSNAGLTMKSDPYIGYYKSNFADMPCYFFGGQPLSSFSFGPEGVNLVCFNP